MVKDFPELEQFADAVKAGEVSIDDGYVPTVDESAGLKLKLSELIPITGQTWHWPEYTGAIELTGPNQVNPNAGLNLDAWWEDLTVPLFTEEEWDEFPCIDERELLDDIDFPGKEQFILPKLQTVEDRICVVNQRTYDPNYGRAIFEDNRCSCWCHADGPVFVKRGWGTWIVVEFNNGQGGKVCRRFFQHDHVDHSFIEEAADSQDPLTFSDENFKNLRLWSIQPIDLSWFYIRRRTMPRDEMIAALEADLEDLKKTEVLGERDFQERVLDYLQNYVRPLEDRKGWREGTCTYPRRDDGTVDAEAFTKHYPDFKDAAA